MFGMFGGGMENGGIGNVFGYGANQFPQRFDEHYRCYPVSFCDKAHLESGDKIVLPPSALDTLARLHIDYPMLFRLTNEETDRHSHCGVMEFSAPEGSCFLPYWMMQNLFINEGGIIRIESATLPKATFVKLRPQSTDFLDISNPRAVLEASLRRFSCMTVGDTICLSYNDRKYFLDVRQVKPADAACIIETDCEVDFEPPADYVPATPVTVPAPISAAQASAKYSSSSFSTNTLNGAKMGGGLRLNKGESSNSTDPEVLRAARLRKYEAFHGTGRSLAGDVSTLSGGNMLQGMEVKGGANSMEKSTEKEEKSSSSTKSVPFQGTGRRLR